MSFILLHFNYVAVAILMMAGLFVVVSSGNLIKRMIGLAIFQTSTGLLYISLGKVSSGTAAITVDAASPEKQALANHLDPAYVAQYGVDGVVYSNPLPHVLILTAIVVGVATLAVGLAIAVRVREAFGSVEADEIEVLSRLESAQAGSQA
ncbi:MAG: cation:proton antiporter subunit C [Hyphomonadaceae bacterium]